MSDYRNQVEWLSILNRQTKIIFFSARVFYCLLATAFISLIVLNAIGTLSQRNFASLWFLLATFSLILTHSGIDDYLKRFKAAPNSRKNWINLNTQWQPLKPNNKNKNYKTIDGFSGIPFQNLSDLDTIVEVKSGKKQFCIILCRDRKKKFHARIPFSLAGLHPDRSDETVRANLDIISAALTDYPKDENLDIVMGARSQYFSEYLEKLGEQSIPDSIGAINFNQVERNKKLTAQRYRQEWHHLAFGSWHEVSPNKYLVNSDFWGWAAAWHSKVVRGLSKFLRGKNSTIKLEYGKLALQIYRDGFLKWDNFFQKGGLEARAVSKEEAWKYLWYQWNPQESIAPPLPHWVEVELTSSGFRTQIKIREKCDLISRLLGGSGASSSTPTGKRTTVKVGNNYCALVYLKKPLSRWKPTEQLKWYWNLIAKFGDIEVKVSLKWLDKKEKLADLVTLGREATSFDRIANQFGDNYANFDNLGFSSSDAREELEGDAQIFELRVGFFIYRPTLRELEEVVQNLCESTFGVTLKREEISTAQRWVESLPINDLDFLSSIGEKYSHPIFTNKSIVGYLPLCRPKTIHSEGIEFLSDSMPIHINPLSSGVSEEGSRILIAGISGSGKSSFATRLITFAQSQNPIYLTIVVDLSEQGTGTYKLYTKLLGRHGAFVDLSEYSFNPLEPPFWQDRQIVKKRYAIWQNDLKNFLLKIFNGQIKNDLMLNRIGIITSLLLRAFLSDPITVGKFEKFWQRGAECRSNLDTIECLKKYLDPATLKIDRPSEEDFAAIAQIRRSIEAIAADPFLGFALCRPSNIPMHASMYVIAFSGAAVRSQQAFIMSGLSELLVNKLCLGAVNSLLIIEEFSRLSKSIGFDDLAGENSNISRKEGRTILIVVHDLEDLEKCNSSTNILANFNYCFIGKNNPKTLAKYEKSWEIPREIIQQLSSDAANQDRNKLTSKFLLLRGRNYHYLEIPSPPLELALIATSPGETKRRQAVLSLPEFSNNLKNVLSGIKKFSHDEYYH